MYRTSCLFATLLAVCCLSISCKLDNQQVNHNYMWFDCEADYAALSSPDSIEFYLEKCRDLGFGNVVVDMKPFMGEVLYDSKKAFDEYLTTVK